ncbi:MAG: hypothetical protein JOZ11_16080 [Alphaproteobacteria bacterium]|nr:hypothetical protein [Alphaproteobacteria bacterium]
MNNKAALASSFRVILRDVNGQPICSAKGRGDHAARTINQPAQRPDTARRGEARFRGEAVAGRRRAAQQHGCGFFGSHAEYDLVEAVAVRNPYLKASIEQSREKIYAA